MVNCCTNSFYANIENEHDLEIKSINKKSKSYEIKFSYITNRCGQQAR